MSKELDSPFVPTGFAVRAIIPSGTQGLRARLRALGCSDWPPGPAQFARCAQRSAPRAVRLPRSPAAVVKATQRRAVTPPERIKTDASVGRVQSTRMGEKPP